ncbi:hypothetical protein HGRIS_006393 [Hohenbuehelia grisea]|uniref:AMP-dependent synthetase/ligase domain-containing protein n=1 Tax=Hohenbuehelia grisea TaxID=104357 RepID=A0ABR3K264_9AGAR
MKAGQIPFPIFPTNSAAGLLNLLKKSGCRRLLATQDCRESLVHELQREIQAESLGFSLELADFPSTLQAFPFLAHEKRHHPFIPYLTSRPRPCSKDVAMYFHSSGSTGFPKAIPTPHATLLSWAAFASTRGVVSNMAASFAFPAFGVAGFSKQVLAPLFSRTPVFVFPPTQISPSLPIALTADNVMVHMQRNRLKKMAVFPAFLHDWSTDAAAVEFLRSLDYVMYAGGPLPPSIGKTLVDQGVNLKMEYGASEIGSVTLSEGKADREDWEYFEWNPLVKLTFSTGVDGRTEIHVLATERHHLAIVNTPDQMGYDLPDIFERHPTKEGLWRILGRRDDVFIDATGANVVPGPIETTVKGSLHVKNAVMFGEHRMQTGILIQPNDDAAAAHNEGALRDKVWPTIEEGNRITQRYARIKKSMILFTTPSKPLPLNAKGLVRRKEALKLYEQEIDTLYRQTDAEGYRYEIAAL